MLNITKGTALHLGLAWRFFGGFLRFKNHTTTHTTTPWMSGVFIEDPSWGKLLPNLTLRLLIEAVNDTNGLSEGNDEIEDPL